MFVLVGLSSLSQPKQILNHDSAYTAYITLYDSASEFIVSNPALSAKLFKESYLALELVLRSEKSNGSFSKSTVKGRRLKEDYESLTRSRNIADSSENYTSDEVISAYTELIKSGSWYNKSEQIEWAHKGVEYAKSINDTHQIIRWNVFLGDANNHLVLPANAENNFKEARDYLNVYSGEKKSLEIFWYQRYASLRNSLQDLDESIRCSKKALELIQQDSQSLGVTFNELGYSYSVQLKNELAKSYFEKAIDCWYPNNKNLAIAYLNLSNIYLREGRDKEVLPFLNNALYYAQRDGVTWVSRSANGKLGKIYFEQGNIEKAYYYEIIGRHIASFQTRLQKADEILRVEVKYEMSERLNEIREKEELLEEVQLEKEAETRRFITALVFVVITVFGLLAIGFYSRKLRARGEQLEKQQVEIEEKNQELLTAAQLNETLLKEVHHRVKNNLTILSGLFYFEEKEQDDESLKLFLRECNNRIHSMALVHQQLYGSDDLSKIDFASYVHQLTGIISSSINSANKRVEFVVNCNNISLKTEIAIPLAIIITELITNSFKYAFPDTEEGEVGILLNQDSDQYLLEIYDNGIGLNEDLLNGRPKSLGLRLINILSKQLFAERWYKNEENSSFFFRIPKVVANV